MYHITSRMPAICRKISRGHDAVTVWSRSSSLSNGHWMQQPQRICYSVFDQVEPTRSPWPRLFRPSTPSMPEDVDGGSSSGSPGCA
jgi:hypothetical protein